MEISVRPQRTRGTGRLVARQLDGKTRLSEFYQEGAAKIRLPDSFDGKMEAVLINTSGGLTGGDKIDWLVDAAKATDITVTTQACERVYKSSGGQAEIHARLKIGPGAHLSWLPQETILFDRGQLERRLEIDMSADSELIAVESVLLGRKAMGESVTQGLLRDRWRIRREGKLIHAEELLLNGDIAGQAGRSAIMDGATAFATLVYIGPRAEAMTAPIRRLLAGHAAGHAAGLSCWAGKLVIRMVAEEGFDLRKVLIPVISHLRPHHSLPKVWSL